MGLLTTLASLPPFLVGLPAGVLADVVGRELVLVSQIWMLAMAALLAALAALTSMIPMLLLGLDRHSMHQ